MPRSARRWRMPAGSASAEGRLEAMGAFGYAVVGHVAGGESVAGDAENEAGG
ncbi:MAG: hypothetical protein WDN31_01135 [Hyphomicrobium sp.]